MDVGQGVADVATKELAAAGAIVVGKDLKPHAAAVHDRNTKTFQEGREHGLLGAGAGLAVNAARLPGDAKRYFKNT